ncbi:MAG: isopentenyl-diphosphate Delta-isomerase [Rhodovulum sulfidophilum]|uniref:Isopentenyl-diphosphate Delta-isomerase n=1 Tax=Rhodovulum sulfidophilum TaxID=35806 RepID=A0A2W5NPJ0_RHOSU|nr:MAG: isopentenyl-diphosphate Delta-isomerase [Rhodovulum sulfidophilum]
MTQEIPAWVGDRLVPLDKLEVHRRGLRHPAVSVFLLDGARLLIQRRALGKYHTPGLWANTCCTHPGWGEAPADCAARRLGEELGLAGVALAPRGEVEYRAEVGPGMIEHEHVHLFAGRWAPGLAVRPDPAEVMDWRWITLDALGAEIAAAPERFTPWLRIYLARHSAAIFGAAA